MNRLVLALGMLLISLPWCAPGRSTPAPVVGACQQPKPGNLTLAGLAYGAYHAGQDPNYAVYPSADEVAADIPTLVCLSSNIRIYSSLGPAADIVRDAERAHLSVNLGIWLGRDAAANAREMTDGMQLMSSPAVSTVTVGNEVLLRGDLTVADLRSAIQRVRKAAAGMRQQPKVTTADVDGSWLAHPELARDVDIVTVHLYPFWEEVPIANAIDSVDRAYAKVRSAFPGKKVVIGETGWPSDGPAQGGAIPSGANQQRYFRDFVDWAKRGRVDYYYFDAFDEAWKTNESGVGTHWGLYDQDGVLKPAFRGLLPPASPTTLSARSSRDVYVRGLMTGLDIGIDTSDQQRDWLKSEQGVLTLQYPDKQSWGVMFITFGKPVPPGNRPGIDFSRYRSLTADMRWVSGAGSCVGLGIKDRTQPDDGTETTVERCFTSTEWSTVSIPLRAFKGADLTQLYVVFEIVFSNVPLTVQLRNVRYSPDDAPSPSPGPTVAPVPTVAPAPTAEPVPPTGVPTLAPVPAPTATPAPTPSNMRQIYSDGGLMAGFDMGIDTSGHVFGWLTVGQGTITLRYPDQQAWGVTDTVKTGENDR